MPATALLHPPHCAGSRVEPVRRAAGQHHGIDALHEVKRRCGVQLARAGGAADHRGRTAKRAVHAADDRQARCARVVGRVTDREPECGEVGAHAPGAGAFAGVTPARREQSAQRRTPRMLHMLQTNRPQSAHG
jgi:hypothetical protein